MKLRLLMKLAHRNLKSNSDIFIPYILSNGIMFGINYIFISLMGNEFIKTRHVETIALLQREIM